MSSKHLHTVFETEKKFRCSEIDKVIHHAVAIGFTKIHKDLREHDIYFTDKDHRFIQQRVCLRIRQTDTHCEITHKGRSEDSGALYSKLENNIEIAPNAKESAIVLLQSLGFIKYVEIKKIRSIYSKKVENLVYNIAIDHIENAGYFIEFEILSQYPIKENQIKMFFESFIALFRDFDLQEEKLPYRDIVKKISTNKNLK